MSYEQLRDNNMWHYRSTPSGRIELWHGHVKHEETDEVAVAFECSNGVMVFMKHGSPESVQSWAAETTKKWGATSGLDLDLRVYTGPFKVEELNWLLQSSGYGPEFLRRHGIGEGEDCGHSREAVRGDEESPARETVEETDGGRGDDYPF